MSAAGTCVKKERRGLWGNASGFIFTVGLGLKLNAINKAGEKSIGFHRAEVSGTDVLRRLAEENQERGRTTPDQKFQALLPIEILRSEVP